MFWPENARVPANCCCTWRFTRRTQGPRRGALSSALRHSLFHHRHHAAQRADFRIRDIHRSAAVAPYETPGTQAFAETVLPFVQDHNTILLQNHGLVCWSDTVTHAEWLVEVMDTCCKTYLLAKQIGKPLSVIPTAKFRKF